MHDTKYTDDWRSLCERASQERDPQKLLELITKINRALEQCQQPGRSQERSLKVDTVLPPISMIGGEFELYSFPGECAASIEYDC